MALASIKMSGDNKIFIEFLNPSKFAKVLDKEIRRATLANALFLIKRIQKGINSNKFKKNSPLTLALKKSNKPLFNEGNLFNAIDHKLDGAFKAEVGIIRAQKSTGGVTGQTIQMKKLVELMESGYTIKVTPAMKRALGMKLADANIPKGEDSGGDDGTTSFFVPPRPLFTKALSNPRVEKQVRKRYSRALEKVYRKMGVKGGDEREK